VSISSVALAGLRAGEGGEGLASSSCACTNECAMVPNTGMPKRAPPHGGGAGEAGEVAGPRRQQPGLGAVRAAQAEVDQRPARRGEHAARRLAGDQRLQVHQVQHPALDQLRLAQRRAHAQQRLVGKNTVPSGIASTSPVKRSRAASRERRLEAPAGGEPVELVVGKAQRQQVLEPPARARRRAGSCARRQRAHEQLEHRGVVHAARPGTPAAWSVRTGR
jgi:hypothetical protein